MNDAQAYHNYCTAMMQLALTLFDGEMDKHELPKLELGQGIDFLAAPHPVGNKWLTEPYSIWAKTRNPKLGDNADIETIQITICPAEGWKPVSFVMSTSLDPVQFETTGSAENDMATIWKQVEVCFARLK